MYFQFKNQFLLSVQKYIFCAHLAKLAIINVQVNIVTVPGKFEVTHVKQVTKAVQYIVLSADMLLL